MGTPRWLWCRWDSEPFRPSTAAEARWKALACSAAHDVQPARTYELCQQIGESPQLFAAVLGLCRLYSVRSESRKALGFAEQLIALAQHQDASTRLPAAHWLMGANLLWCGEGLRARTHLEQGIALCSLQPHRSLASLYGQDPGVMNRLFAALALWWLGYPDQAVQRGDEALALAREITHPHSEASALVFTAWLHQLRREHQTVYDRAEAAMTLSTEQGFTFWSAHGMFWLGWAQTKQGYWHEGIARMQHSLDDRRRLGANASRSVFVAELADAHAHAGQIDTACSLLGDALTIVHQTGERFYEAEVHRWRGALYLVQSPEYQQAAETCYRKALDLARGQPAKSLELRAATSLARLWHSQDKRQEAYDLLAPVYGWFTEGFDTADLLEAQGTLDELV
jgi:predicted ATPase